MTRRIPIFLIIFLAAFSIVDLSAARPREIWERYTVVFIGEKRDNPANGAIMHGARTAADVLEHQHKLEITLTDLTPVSPDGQKQALRDAFVEGAKAVIIDIANADALTEELDLLKRQGVYVITIDSEAPADFHLATIENDNHLLGMRAYEATAALLKQGDEISVFAGDLTNPVNQERLDGFQDMAGQVGKLSIAQVYSGEEDVSEAINLIRQVQAGDRDEALDGWVFLGPWPLMSATPLPWEPGEEVCVAIDALPQSLAYLAQGQVNALVTRSYFGWGKSAMEIAINAIHLKETPEKDTYRFGGEIVTRERLDQVAQDWATWMQ